MLLAKLKMLMLTHWLPQVRGKDGVGATMDSMDLEREKGITIQVRNHRCHLRLRAFSVVGCCLRQLLPLV